MAKDLKKDIQRWVRSTVESLARSVHEHDVTSLEIENGGFSVKLVRRRPFERSAAPPAVIEEPRHIEAVPKTQPLIEEPHLVPVQSELVGWFRRGIKSGSPQVEVGTQVTAGQVLCYIDSMTLMNEVKAPQNGRIVEILVDEGHPVEFGQALMALQADAAGVEG